MNALTEAGYHVATRFATVCPKAPPGAQAPVDQILGYVLWAVGILFLLGVVIGIGGLVAGPVFAQVMAASLRQLGVSPDMPEEPATRVTRPQMGTRAGEA